MSTTLETMESKEIYQHCITRNFSTTVQGYGAHVGVSVQKFQ